MCVAPQMVVLLASHKADFFSKIHGLKIHGGSAGYLCRLSLCVPLRAWVRASVHMYVPMWLSVPAIPVGACVCACVCMCLCACVRVYVRAYVARPIQAKKPYDPQKRLKFGLIRLYWYKTA